MPISIFINLICHGTFDGGSRKKIKAGASCKVWTWRVVLSMNYPIEKKINRGKLFMFKPDQLFKIWKVLHNNSVKSLSFPHFDVREINNSNSCLWKRVYCTAFSIFSQLYGEAAILKKKSISLISQTHWYCEDLNDWQSWMEFFIVWVLFMVELSMSYLFFYWESTNNK